MSNQWAMLALLLLAAIGAGAAGEDGPATDAAGREFFEKRIRPLLLENCEQCHGAKKQESGLVLSAPAGLLKGGDRGPPVVPGRPDESLIIQAVGYADDDLKMPPRGKLQEEQIADLVAWVKMGAPLPPVDSAAADAAKPSSEFDLEDRRQHWAYQPVQTAAMPEVQTAAWCASPIDRFLLARLEAAELSPAPPADKRTLIRRLTFDLTGLPPTPANIAAFLADEAPDAYERLVDRLLASPQYGERWARHWLDVVRYSETLGFEFDYDLYNAWRYRDYVIRAFNADLPYDQFVIEHLAGDLLPSSQTASGGHKPTETGRSATESVPYSARHHPLDHCNESILATGFFWMLEGKQTPVDIRQEQADRIDNQIDTLGKALLGQTIACARCHDHKFDAISTRDYYALAGYLKSSRYQQAFLDPPDRSAATLSELAALKAKIDEQARTALADRWLAELSQAARYLLAASTPQPEAKAAELGLDSARLSQWSKSLQHEELARPDHPLHVWSRIREGEARREGEAPAEPAAGSKARQEPRPPTSAGSTRQEPRPPTAMPFLKFREPDFGGWFVTGEAFGIQPAAVGEIIVGDSDQRPIARLTTGGADSGLVSLRLQGELRSPTFTIDKPFIHIRLAGSRGRVNLVIDGYTLIMNPMYGKLTAAPSSSVLTWRTMPVDRWIGHRAYFEVSDCTIPMHGLNPPPSSARVPDSKGDGYIVLDQIVFSDNPEPHEIVVGTGAPTKWVGVPSSKLADAYQQLMIDQVQRWRSGDLAKAAEAADGINLLNWLLENGLLDDRNPAADDELARLLFRYRELEAVIEPPSRAPALADGTGEDEFVFLRGNYRNLGERAVRGPPEVVGTGAPAQRVGVPSDGDNTPNEPATSFEGDGTRSVPATLGSGRLELAQRLVDPANPLLARVIVNRLWQHHFGEGIVRTPDDFGRMGQPPSHPELLDYLAAELVRRGWSLKDITRQMVSASTYRQASVQSSKFKVQSPAANSTLNLELGTWNSVSIDPDNRLLWHMPLRRLEAEAIRDSILAVSGRLDSTMHGPSVLPYLTPYMEGRGKPNSGPLDGGGRRSIYLNARRNFLTPLLLAFDYPVTFTPIGRRGTSALPAQALTLMNDPLVVQQAGEWAGRVLAEGGSTAEQRIWLLYETAFSRPPSDEEVRDAIDFLQHQSLRHGTGSDDLRVWIDLCHVLMNVKEFIFIP